LFIFDLGKGFRHATHYTVKSLISISSLRKKRSFFTIQWVVRKKLGGYHTFHLQGVLGHVRFGDVNNPVNIERNFFRIGRPAFIAEAIEIFSVAISRESVVL
jgi:hypothetical protein